MKMIAETCAILASYAKYRAAIVIVGFISAMGGTVIFRDVRITIGIPVGIIGLLELLGAINEFIGFCS